MLNIGLVKFADEFEKWFNLLTFPIKYKLVDIYILNFFTIKFYFFFSFLLNVSFIRNIHYCNLLGSKYTG